MRKEGVGYYCSFCGKHQNEVHKLIAGPSSFICNECADRCHEMAHEVPGQKFKLPPLPNTPGSFGCQEAMHLADVISEIVERHIARHPAVFLNEDWSAAATKAAKALHDLHDAIGEKHLEAEPVVRERGIVVGFAEPKEQVVPKGSPPRMRMSASSSLRFRPMRPGCPSRSPSVMMRLW